MLGMDLKENTLITLSIPTGEYILCVLVWVKNRPEYASFRKGH